MSTISLTMSVLVSVLVVLVVDEAASCRPPSGRTNGCSVPFGLPYFYKNHFKPDCDKHDVCYGCAANFGRNREYCDDVFYRNIKSRCKSDRSVKSTYFCRFIAVKYYAAVRIGGEPRYENLPLSWCGESWVQCCL